MQRPRSRYCLCSACVELKEVEFHHIEPQKYVKATTNSPGVYLCHDCHLELHKFWIDPLGLQSRQVFIQETVQFLNEKRFSFV